VNLRELGLGKDAAGWLRVRRIHHLRVGVVDGGDAEPWNANRRAVSFLSPSDPTRVG
jgi:hypothetical protein